MKAKDMDLVQMRTLIATEKSKGVKPVRMVFWTKETNEYLKDYIRAREEFLKAQQYEDKDGWLWISANGRWQAGRGWSDRAVEAIMKRLSHEANLGYTANPTGSDITLAVIFLYKELMET